LYPSVFDILGLKWLGEPIFGGFAPLYKFLVLECLRFADEFGCMLNFSMDLLISFEL
jgi:hypothetical protein